MTFANAGSDAVSGGLVCTTLADPEFGSSVNLIPTKGQIISTTLLIAHPGWKT